MEKRIGSALILVESKADIDSLNKILSSHSSIILSRQGLPLKDRQANLISVILEGSTDEIGSLTGKIGRLEFIQVKSVLLKNNTNYEGIL
ncbi:MAG: CopG family transcriptional regulator [Candidatus Kapabacteria bacterium]|nr:CopG family transcriptional regulator [Ignavibacteriota bacterium]MCW5884387.1 CopG family transcriptional regulator [Candidatus Kapabacteria bacterium]